MKLAFQVAVMLVVLSTVNASIWDVIEDALKDASDWTKEKIKQHILQIEPTSLGAHVSIECTYKNKTFDVNVALKEEDPWSDNRLVKKNFRNRRERFEFDIEDEITQISDGLWPYLHIKHTCTKYGRELVHDEPLAWHVPVPNYGVPYRANVTIVLGDVNDRVNMSAYKITEQLKMKKPLLSEKKRNSKVPSSRSL